MNIQTIRLDSADELEAIYLYDARVQAADEEFSNLQDASAFRILELWDLDSMTGYQILFKITKPLRISELTSNMLEF